MSDYNQYFDFISSINAVLAKDLPAMMPLMRRLFPICRSITGEGTRQTLDIIGEMIPLQHTRVPTATKCFDWEVPREWNIRDAYVKDSKGKRVIDFKASNLHVVNYSIPVRLRLSLTELQNHLHSRPDYPDAIPYLASYYNDYWGFCLAHEQRKNLPEETYEVVIDSTIGPGYLDYAQSHLEGSHEKRNIFFHEYLPSIDGQ